MNHHSRYSATIEKMRVARNVPTTENRKTWTDRPTSPPPPPTRIHPRLRPLRKVIRRDLGLRDATEIHAVLEDVQVLLVRCGFHLHLMRTERTLLRREARRAARDPRRASLRRGRGRPADGVNFAYHQLGLGLAVIWSAFTGRRLPIGRDSLRERGRVARFRSFVEEVLTAIPACLWVRRKGHVPSIDTFIRASREAAKEALDTPQVYRRMGLLDERRWLPEDAKPVAAGIGHIA